MKLFHVKKFVFKEKRKYFDYEKKQIYGTNNSCIFFYTPIHVPGVYCFQKYVRTSESPSACKSEKLTIIIVSKIHTLLSAQY